MGSRALYAYLGAAGLLAVAYLLVPAPSARYALWLTLLAGSLLVATVALRAYRPHAPAPWHTLIVGLALTGLSNLLEAPWWGPVTSPRAEVAKLLSMVGFLLIGVTAVLFARSQHGERGRGPVLDSVIVTVALTAVAWEAILARHGWSAAQGMALVEALFGTLVAAWVVAMTLRLVLAGGYRVASGWALFAAGVLGFTATSTFVYLELDHRLALDHPRDLLWLGCVVAFGVAVLHPRMRELTTGDTAHEQDETLLRTVLPSFALLLPPLAVLVRGYAEGVLAPVAALSALIVGGVVILRFVGLVRDKTRARGEVVRHAERESALAGLGERGLAGQDEASLLAFAESILAPDLGAVTLRSVEPPGPSCPDADLSGEPRPDADLPGEPDPGAGLPGSRGLVTVAGTGDLDVPADAAAFVRSVGHVLATAVTRQRIETEVRRQSLHDPLTGLANRSLLDLRLEHARGRRHEADRGLAVVFVDLDGFKAVNDRLGHAAGDALLVAVSRRLAANVRPGDTVARFAGDEFVLVLEDIHGSEVTRTCERVRAALAEPVWLPEAEHVTVSASLGAVVAGAGDPRDASALLHDADAAMYVAKQEGRDRVHLAGTALPVGEAR